MVVTPIPGYLQLVKKARLLVGVNKPARLYRSICKEIPRVFMIYDIDMPVEVAKLSIRRKFAEKASLKDEGIIDRLIDLGYMELESVLLQHKQRSHLMYTLEGQEGIFGETSGRKQLPPNASIDDQFNRN